MVTLNPIFSNGMVMQANKPVRIFGKGQGCVTVEFLGQTKNATSQKEWLVEFEPQEYGGPYTMTISLDGKKTELSDIYFGDVYLLSGQSNIQFKMWERKEPADVYEGNENVRLFTVDRMEENTEERWGVADGWVTLTEENAKDFSAIGYYMSQELAKNGHKVGLIACYQGASVIQSWLKKEVAQRAELQVENKFADHEWFPIWNDDGVLYDFMLSKIIPYAMASVIWYQGESNASVDEARIYLRFLDALTSSWREDFMDKDLKFIIIQLADYIERDTEGWHLVQKAQSEAQKKLKNVKTVVCRDVCEVDDIHPRSKKELSMRIAKALLG
ncbi:MAG: sialate O-acetylesterase [Ruminococcaceae bacterium]|nr:sialate O-acetylesterase [Oscillospiraceae bacterium]